MTQTEHYQLPQWEARDPVRREDFNEAMNRIEAGLEGASERHYVVGIYTGNGGTLNIELGFTPRFLLVNPKGTNTVVPTSIFTNSAMTGETVYKPTLLMTDTGFQVLAYENLSNYTNADGTIYAYLAFH